MFQPVGLHQQYEKMRKGWCLNKSWLAGVKNDVMKKCAEYLMRIKMNYKC